MQPQMQPLYDTFRFCKGKNATPNATPSATPTRFFTHLQAQKRPFRQSEYRNGRIVVFENRSNTVKSMF